jgi:hypothetical protein
VLFD